MSLRNDINTDVATLAADLKRLEGENARLRQLNAQMLEALSCALPILQDGPFPGFSDFETLNVAIRKVQDARAKAEDADNSPGEID
ncbi:MAG: hypothetical protein WBX25_30040 [Rhodomicrobium sp.]